MKNWELSKTWSVIAYPESAPCEWKKILKDTAYKITISPLHTKDIVSDADIKNHYHIMAECAEYISFGEIKSISDKLNSPTPMKIPSPSRYYDYLYNGYDEKDIEVFNG